MTDWNIDFYRYRDPSVMSQEGEGGSFAHGIIADMFSYELHIYKKNIKWLFGMHAFFQIFV